MAETGAIGVAGLVAGGISTSAMIPDPSKVSIRYRKRHTYGRELQQRGDANTYA